MHDLKADPETENPGHRHVILARASHGLFVLLKRYRGAVAALLVGIYLLSGVYFVPADEQAIQFRLGRILPGRVSPGLHYALPFPIDRVVRLRMNEAQRLAIGGDDLTRALGVSNESSNEYLLTGDQNLVMLQAWIQYYIKEPGDYLTRSEDLTRLLETSFFRCMTRAVANRGVDEVLTTGRITLQNQVQKALQDECDRLRLGVSISTVALEEVRPPEEVRESFLDVANAREDRSRIVQVAVGYSNELLPRVRGRAQQLRQQAEVYRTELVNRAQGEAERFTQVLDQYRKHRDVTRTRLFLETLEQVLPRIRTVILDEKGTAQGVDLDILEIEKP